MAKRILTVDDSANMSQGVRFRRWLSSAVNLMIAGLYMPNLDGIGLIRSVRANPALSGQAAGATSRIVKPFTPQQILMVVRRVLG